MEINAFIAHRCKEFDYQPIRKGFENFLKEKGLTSVYGCTLNRNRGGIISENIPIAIKKSHIFIAIITKTWVDVTDKIGWPKRELNLWMAHDDIYRSLMIGLLFDIERGYIDYIEDFLNFPIKKESKEEYNKFLFNDSHNRYYVRGTDFSVIQNQLDGYIEEVKEIRKKKETGGSVTGNDTK